MAADGPIASHADALRFIARLRAAVEAADPRKTATETALRAQAALRLGFVVKALGRVGVNLNAYAMREARWLASQPLERIAVVVDWLGQAAMAGNAELLAQASEYIDPCPARADGRCLHGESATCDRTDTAWRLKGIDPAQARRNALAALSED